jgi:hypothetical protein
MSDMIQLVVVNRDNKAGMLLESAAAQRQTEVCRTFGVRYALACRRGMEDSSFIAARPSRTTTTN